jgi:hypothetical protein
MVFRYKSNMHRLGIGLSFFEPEKRFFAVAKTLQIGMAGMAFVGNGRKRYGQHVPTASVSQDFRCHIDVLLGVSDGYKRL